MPKYMMLIVEDEKAFEGVEAGSPKFDEVMQMHGDFSAAVERSGAKILGGEALQPTSTATFLRGTRTAGVKAVDNPAPDLKEVLGGYWIIVARSLREAAAIAAENPCVPYGLHFEIRPLEAEKASAYKVTNETPTG